MPPTTDLVGHALPLAQDAAEEGAASPWTPSPGSPYISDTPIPALGTIEHPAGALPGPVHWPQACTTPTDGVPRAHRGMEPCYSSLAVTVIFPSLSVASPSGAHFFF